MAVSQSLVGGSAAEGSELIAKTGLAGQRASAGQERSLGMIQAAVAELGRPPADLTRQGALAELLAKRSYTGEKLVYPHLRVAPMGWNHALWWCQRIHEFHAFRQPGVSLSNKLSDKKPGVRLGRSGFAHTEYVDNFAAIGRQAKEVDAVADSVLDALTAAGLSMHPRESSVGGSVLGWEFSDECPQVRVSPRRAWGLRLGIEGPLEKGFATGRDLEAIIGHFTFAARIRPEALRVFSAAYAFSQRGELDLAAAAGLDDLDRVGTARHLEALGEVDRSGAVPEIGPEILQGSWATVSAGRWKRREAMPILEGRALVWGVRHVSRGLSEFGKRILFLTDGLSEVLALEKGRSSSVALMRVCRQWAATVFAADLYPRVRWIRSELNVADEPSRRYQPKPFGLKPGCFRPPPGLPEPDDDRPPAATRRCPDPVGPVGCGPGDRQPGEAGRGCGAATRPGRAADPVASGGAVTGWRATAPTPWAGPGKGSGETSQASARRAGREGEARRCPANEFPVDKRATVSEGLSLLERESAGDHDQRVYQSALVEFRIFSETLGLRLETAQDYDEAAVEWTYPAVFDGSDALEGTRLKARLLYYYPRLLSVAGLPQFSRALRGWRRLGSPRSQLPLPGEVACAVAHRLAANQDLHAARLVFVSFVFGLQPAELVSLTGRQVAPPARAAGHAAWSLVLFPMEEETPSKDGAFNESVLGDLPFCHLIGDVLKPLEAGVDDRDLVAQVRHVQLAQAFGTADQRLGLEGPPGLYQLRHGGAPVDLASYRRSIAEVRARSRWASDSSVTGYGNGGRVADQLIKLPPPFLDHAIVRAKKNGDILCEHCRPLPPVRAGP
ncbi:unnamed protein product [Prorocentrum cordatum]|uniref:Uncharacterized protein n=1 Tax=Prorocentrum cordatum TaxID=2364126 RepID=A0ABN9SI18_9DINO|nr:unnamed protein product [Polarella glacialis]